MVMLVLRTFPELAWRCVQKLVELVWRFGHEKAALKLNAEWLLQMDCIKITEVKDTWLVKVPHVPMPF